MATGYTIRLGYSSGATWHDTTDKAWQRLQDIVADVREDPILIAQHVSMIPRNTYLSDMHEDEFFEYIEIYRHNRKGSPVSVGSMGDDRFIMVMCSGGGDSRIAKEIVARAFVLAVISECFRNGIDVSFTTA